MELSSETVKNTNESIKRLALVEQERDFLRRDLQNARENMVKRENEFSESMRLVREKEEKIKSMRGKKKVLTKEIEDLKSQVLILSS